jgi:hypothetical protein
MGAWNKENSQGHWLYSRALKLTGYRPDADGALNEKLEQEYRQEFERSM